jgi:hypothetical protein
MDSQRNDIKFGTWMFFERASDVKIMRQNNPGRGNSKCKDHKFKT